MPCETKISLWKRSQAFLSGFGAKWPWRILCSEYFEDVEANFSDIPHQDLCELMLSSSSFDLVLCNELFEHVKTMEMAFAENARVLKAGGRLVATCSLAFGQSESIVKAVFGSTTGETQILGEAELHVDPVKPDQDSLVYRITGWAVLEQLKLAGFQQARIHYTLRCKHGILVSDMPGVMVIEAQK
jgi:SAM-dependent methyltransferase